MLSIFTVCKLCIAQHSHTHASSVIIKEIWIFGCHPFRNEEFIVHRCNDKIPLEIVRIAPNRIAITMDQCAYFCIVVEYHFRFDFCYFSPRIIVYDIRISVRSMWVPALSLKNCWTSIQRTYNQFGYDGFTSHKVCWSVLLHVCRVREGGVILYATNQSFTHSDFRTKLDHRTMYKHIQQHGANSIFFSVSVSLSNTTTHTHTHTPLIQLSRMGECVCVSRSSSCFM